MPEAGCYAQPVRALLLNAARAAIGCAPDDRHAMTPDDWRVVPHAAEAAHLTPLLHAYLRGRREAVPATALAELEALLLRQRAWQRARWAALAEIVHAFERRAIDVVILKGAALAWTIYPSPMLRPMSDVDLLVRPDAARHARDALQEIGFRSEDGSLRPHGRSHHFPGMSRIDGGLKVIVEVHVDALSRDSFASVSMLNLTAPLLPFQCGGLAAQTLGPFDGIRHLAHHLLEPAWDGEVRLIGVVDLLRYAVAFDDRIDWTRLGMIDPIVANAIGCLHFLLPLPGPLARFAPSPATRPPQRVGETMRPLRVILARGRLGGMMRELFGPPEWWLRMYYAVPLEKSLAGVRMCRHPWRMARWLCRRAANG